MKSWISIPFYLWKNTSRRWFEYPVSPVSKILIPVLLGFLSVLVLGLFSLVELELRQRLAQNSAYTVVSNEFVQAGAAATLLGSIQQEEMMLQVRFRASMIISARQPLASAMLQGRSIPVLAFSGRPHESLPDWQTEDPPAIYLMVSDPTRWESEHEISYGNLWSRAQVHKTPEWMINALAIDEAVIVATELVEPTLRKGFINHTVAHHGDIEQLRRYVDEARAFYRAEGRKVKITSALPILEELERIRHLQSLAKTLIVIGCGVILALTLGSIAWLEYRQDAYLMALLRSFGTPGFILLWHMFMENLALVVSGILLVWFSWRAIYERCLPQMAEFGIQSKEVPELAAQDFWVLMTSGTIGVLLAMVPMAVALRKQPGLLLQ